MIKVMNDKGTMKETFSYTLPELICDNSGPFRLNPAINHAPVLHLFGEDGCKGKAGFIG